MSFSYRFLDDVAMADLAFEATGDSLEDVFVAATGALMDAMADPATVGTAWEQKVEREDRDPAALLFDWLSDLVYYKDAAGVVFSKVDLHLVQSGDRWRLTAMVHGGPVDPVKQDLRADVKGVTKHLYEVTQRDGRWTARVVLDV
jgi:SHS2 domain-containing protein